MTGRYKIFTSDDAVSEVVDFSITLGIMLLAISIIGLVGYPLIEHMKESGHIENIKQSFSVLTPNMNKIVSGKAPSQSVELKMYGGGVFITGSSYMNITMDKWNDSSSSIDTISFERQLRMIQNDYKYTTIAYENTGAWARYPPGGSVMVTKPMFAYDDSSMIIPMVTITGTKGISGSGLIRVISEGGQLAVEKYENVSRVRIEISSEYYDAWARYLDNSVGMQMIDLNSSSRTAIMEKNYSQNIDVFVTVSPMSVTVE
ncbi:DUF7289 family protein [Methanolobus profundi]|uniref:Uncharacterized protein n=1 Tax=Methanolobus profundi TaxID=487685 RepID=A0A1I4SRM7_9EURY|nr:hypothetical protein [Methanolobus profundi]SFM67000.1 hypothetical protein SAMN04488696_1974 [Methanolobus profundi]